MQRVAEQATCSLLADVSELALRMQRELYLQAISFILCLRSFLYISTVYFSLKVVFGGGRRKLLPHHVSDPENPKYRGQRSDGRNLIDEWISQRRRNGRDAQFVWNSRQFYEMSDGVDDTLGKRGRNGVIKGAGEREGER